MGKHVCELKEGYYVFDVVGVEEETLRMYPMKQVMVFSDGTELFEVIQQKAVEKYKTFFQVDTNSPFYPVHYGCVQQKRLRSNFVEMFKRECLDILTVEKEEKENETSYVVFEVAGLNDKTGRLLNIAKVLLSVRKGDSFDIAKEKAISIVKEKYNQLDTIRYSSYFKEVVNAEFLEQFKEENPDILTE